MSRENKQDTLGPVAKLRERYYERKRNQKPLTESEKEAFRRDKEQDVENIQKERKISRGSALDREFDLE